MQAQDKTDVDIKLLSSFSFPVQTRHQSGRYCLYRVTVGMGGGCLCRYFGQNISQLKCSAGQSDVREIKTNILGKIRDKDKAVRPSGKNNHLTPSWNNKSERVCHPLHSTFRLGIYQVSNKYFSLLTSQC